VAHIYNPSYSGGRDQVDQSSKPTQANSSRDLISKNPITKNWAGGVAQGEGPEFKSQYPPPPKKKEALLATKMLRNTLLGLESPSLFSKQIIFKKNVKKKKNLHLERSPKLLLFSLL
jgi:hypothetical protein